MRFGWIGALLTIAFERRAAHARAWGPPPDAPTTANRATPRASTICSTSPPADAT